MSQVKEARTQAELDTVVSEYNSDADAYMLHVQLRGDGFLVMPSGIVKDVRVDVHDTVRLESFSGRETRGSYVVFAYDDAQVTAHGENQVEAMGRSKVEARDQVRVSAYEDAQVTAHGTAVVSLYDRASAIVCDKVRVADANDRSRVIASGKATATLFEDATIEAYDQVAVHAYDRTRVRAAGQVVVDAYETSRVDAFDTALVRAYGPVTVVATDRVHTWREDAHADITGGVILDGVSREYLADAAEWCKAHGVEVEDGMAVVYKALGNDLIAGQDHDMPTLYEKGTRVEAPDWDAVRECGNGLHFSPRPHYANTYRFGATRWMRVHIPVADAIPLDYAGAPKIKAPWCDVVAEVDMFGHDIEGREDLAWMVEDNQEL
jgi:hypothetical protein